MWKILLVATEQQTQREKQRKVQQTKHKIKCKKTTKIENKNNLIKLLLEGRVLIHQQQEDYLEVIEIVIRMKKSNTLINFIT